MIKRNRARITVKSRTLSFNFKDKDLNISKKIVF